MTISSAVCRQPQEQPMSEPPDDYQRARAIWNIARERLCPAHREIAKFTESKAEKAHCARFSKSSRSLRAWNTPSPLRSVGSIHQAHDVRNSSNCLTLRSKALPASSSSRNAFRICIWLRRTNRESQLPTGVLAITMSYSRWYVS